MGLPWGYCRLDLAGLPTQRLCRSPPCDACPLGSPALSDPPPLSVGRFGRRLEPRAL